MKNEQHSKQFFLIDVESFSKNDDILNELIKENTITNRIIKYTQIVSGGKKSQKRLIFHWTVDGFDANK